MESDDQIIKFDCRGTQFTCSKTNIDFFEDSALSILVSGNHFVTMEDDVIKVDRNPRIFKHLIEFLENGRKIPEVTAENGDFIVCLGEEFTFWDIPITLYDSVILTDPEDRKYVNDELVEGRPLKLLYRATNYKCRSRYFHKYVDGHKETLVVIKARNGNILGGYTS